MREKIFVLTSRAVDAAGGLFFLKLISTLVSKSEVGDYLLMASLLAMITALSTAALDVGIMRHVDSYKLDGSLSKRYSSILGVYVGVGFLLILFSKILIHQPWISWDGLKWAPILSIWFLCDVVRSFALNIAGSLRARGRVLLVSLVEQTMRLSLLLYFSRQTEMHSEGIVYLLCFSSLSSGLACIFAQKNMLTRFHWKDAASTITESVKFVWPMIAWGGFSWLQNMSSRWVLDYFGTPVDVAEFGVFVIMANFPIAAMLGVVVAYMLPILYERENIERGSSRALIRQASLLLGLACAVLVVIFFMFHQQLVPMISSPAYEERSYVVPWLMLAISCSALGSVFALSVYVEKRLHLLVAANVIPGIAVVGMGIVLIREYGFSGAVLAFSVGHMLAGILFMLAHKKSNTHG